MVSTSFFADGEIYDTALVETNEHPASTEVSQAPASFFADGAVYDTAEVISNDTPGNTAPSSAPSSFYPGGNIYDFLSQESVIVELLQALAAQTTTNASAASTSASQSSTSASQAATSAATAAATAAAAVQSAAGTATPLVDGTATVGTSTKWAHEDHVHPTDTSRASVTALNAAVAPKADTTYVDAQDAHAVRWDVAQTLTAPQKTQARSNTGAQADLGFTPVRQGGGAGQLTNTVYIGWAGSSLKVQVDSTDLGPLAFRASTLAGYGITDAQPALGYTPYPNTGGVISGVITVNSGSGTGIVYLNAAQSRYVYFDGSNYQMGGSHLYTAAGRVLGASTDAGLIINGRLAFAADRNPPQSAFEPYAGAVLTGASGSNYDGAGNLWQRYRYMQLQNLAGSWFTIGYA